jgi:septal ring factor EnvC (AmiA/AmiB activator)
MKPCTFVFSAALVICAAATAGAQAPTAPAVQEMAPVTVTAQRTGTLYRIAHIEEQRRYVLELVEQNRRLSADLRRADSKVTQLEERLVDVKADHDRRVADIAAVDSATADARRARLELEAKLRRLEAAPPATHDGNGSR